MFEHDFVDKDIMKEIFSEEIQVGVGSQTRGNGLRYLSVFACCYFDFEGLLFYFPFKTSRCT